MLTEKGPPSFGVRVGNRERGPPNLGATEFPPLVARLRREFHRCSARKTNEKCTENAPVAPENARDGGSYIGKMHECGKRLHENLSNPEKR